MPSEVQMDPHYTPTIADINNDGNVEILVGVSDFQDKLFALRGSDGSILWTYDSSLCSPNPPMVEDINGDGNVEVVFSECGVKALRGTDGFLIWSSYSGGIFSLPAIGDINNDGMVEVAVGYYDLYYRGRVFALRGMDIHPLRLGI